MVTVQEARHGTAEKTDAGTAVAAASLSQGSLRPPAEQGKHDSPQAGGGSRVPPTLWFQTSDSQDWESMDLLFDNCIVVVVVVRYLVVCACLLACFLIGDGGNLTQVSIHAQEELCQ